VITATQEEDWQLNTSPVVKLKRLTKRSVHFSFIWCCWCRSFQRIASAYMLSPVCPSVTQVDHSRTAEVTVMKFSPYDSPIPLLLCGVSLIQKF